MNLSFYSNLTHFPDSHLLPCPRKNLGPSHSVKYHILDLFKNKWPPVSFLYWNSGALLICIILRAAFFVWQIPKYGIYRSKGQCNLNFNIFILSHTQKYECLIIHTLTSLSYQSFQLLPSTSTKIQFCYYFNNLKLRIYISPATDKIKQPFICLYGTCTFFDPLGHLSSYWFIKAFSKVKDLNSFLCVHAANIFF